MATHYIVGCGAIARNSEGRFLMVRQMGGYWRGQWIFPGGKLELGETPEQCARREFLEETYCDITIKKLVGAYVSYDPDTEFEKQVVLIYFQGNSVCGEPRAGEGVTDVRWLSLEELESLEKSGQVPHIIIQIAKDTLKIK